MKNTLFCNLHYAHEQWHNAYMNAKPITVLEWYAGYCRALQDVITECNLQEDLEQWERDNNKPHLNLLDDRGCECGKD